MLAVRGAGDVIAEPPPCARLGGSQLHLRHPDNTRSDADPIEPGGEEGCRTGPASEQQLARARARGSSGKRRLQNRPDHPAPLRQLPAATGAPARVAHYLVGTMSSICSAAHAHGRRREVPEKGGCRPGTSSHSMTLQAGPVREPGMPAGPHTSMTCFRAAPRRAARAAPPQTPHPPTHARTFRIIRTHSVASVIALEVTSSGCTTRSSSMSLMMPCTHKTAAPQNQPPRRRLRLSARPPAMPPPTPLPKTRPARRPPSSRSAPRSSGPRRAGCAAQ